MIIHMYALSLSRVRLFEVPWTVAHQAPLSMGFPRQEYWRGLPFPPPGDLSNHVSSIGRWIFTTESPGKPTSKRLAYYSIIKWASLMAQMVKMALMACNVGDVGSSPGSGRFPWSRKWQPTLVFLPGESH